MSAPSQAPAPAAVVGPDVSAIVTEDDAPVDNLYSEKQMRLLTDALYTSWGGPPPEESGQRRTFLAAANVGVFKTPKAPPLVPDVLVSVDVGPDPDIWAKEHRSYFIWEFGKEPDVVIEVVSNREGKELDEKKIGYRRMKIPYYVVWDPETFLRSAPLQAPKVPVRPIRRLQQRALQRITLRKSRRCLAISSRSDASSTPMVCAAG